MTHVNITCERFHESLTDYLDGGLRDSDLVDAELHLVACAGCRDLVADVRDIVRNAGALPPLTPSQDLWPGIAARISTPVSPIDAAQRRAARRTWRWSPARAGALAAGLAGAIGLASYLLGARQGGSNVVASAPPPVAESAAVAPPAARDTVGSAAVSPAPAATPQVGAPVAVAFSPSTRPDAESTLDAQIDALRGLLDSPDSRLDPATRAVIANSLRTIDLAITDARQALATDPASAFLADQLNRSLARKVGLLRQAALLAPRT